MKAAVLYDTPSHNVNLLYWGGLDAPDAFFAMKIGEKTIAFVSELEYGRFCSQSKFHEVHLWSEFQKTWPSSDKKTSFWPSFFQFLQKKYDIDTFVIPNDFPASLYAKITPEVPVVLDADFFEKQRAIKMPSEVAEIRKACALTADTLRFAIEKIRNSTVKDGLLYEDGELLTSERLRCEMEIYALQHGGCAQETIVAGGWDAVNPHHSGSGALHAQQFIVLDFFPCLQATHWYGDMTRTVFKGKATEEQKRMYQTVYECQQRLIQQVRPGVCASALMNFAVDFFEKCGYGRQQTEQGCEGFIHSVGHGLGLDLHEYPSVGLQPIRLEPGMVITIEPGLYFSSLGGVRIEDDVLVTENGCEVLSPTNTEKGGFFP